MTPSRLADWATAVLMMSIASATALGVIALTIHLVCSAWRAWTRR